MKKGLLIILCCLFSFSSLHGQRSVKDVEIRELVWEEELPVVIKAGKAPKNKEVTRSIYLMTYVDDTYRNSRWLSVGKYIETYKGKRIKEVLYDTELLKTRGFDPDDISNRVVVTDIINTSVSATDFQSFCCAYDTRSNAIDFGLEVSSVISRKMHKIPGINGFFESFPEDDFLKQLKAEKFDNDAIRDLLDIKKYMDEKYNKYAQYEKDTKSLESTNAKLRERLRSFIQNHQSTRSPDIRVIAYSHDSIQFRLLKESYIANSSFHKKGHLLIQYPNDNPYAGEVYLKQIKSDGNGYYKIMEVYEQNTKKAVPFERLMVQDYLGFKIYGLEGTFSNDDFLSDAEQKSSKDMIKSFKSESDVLAKYENAKFENHYLEREIPIRSKEYTDSQLRASTAAELSMKKANENYEREKGESIAKNGFFLETKDLNNPSNDLDGYTGMLDIYKGDFSELPRFLRSDKITLATMMYQFMRQKATICRSKKSSANPVEIMDDVCSKERVTTNGYGRETGRSCVDWVGKGTGLYTSVKLNQAYMVMKNSQNSVGGIFSMLEYVSKPNDLRRITAIINEIKKDISKLIRLNGCESEALKRFEENLIRFVNGDEPLKLN